MVKLKLLLYLFSETIKKGETLLLPSIIKTYQITSKNAKLLEVYV